MNRAKRALSCRNAWLASSGDGCVPDNDEAAASGGNPRDAQSNASNVDVRLRSSWSTHPRSHSQKHHTKSHHEKSHMKVLYINNDGGGFADYIEVPVGTTVRQLFEQQLGGARPDDYLIRVNRQPCPADQVLQEQDRVSVTPTKIEGAGR